MRIRKEKDISQEDLQLVTLPEVAESIARVRSGEVRIVPGYDGVYGKIEKFFPEKKILSNQKSLF